MPSYVPDEVRQPPGQSRICGADYPGSGDDLIVFLQVVYRYVLVQPFIGPKSWRAIFLYGSRFSGLPLRFRNVAILGSTFLPDAARSTKTISAIPDPSFRGCVIFVILIQE